MRALWRAAHAAYAVLAGLLGWLALAAGAAHAEPPVCTVGTQAVQSMAPCLEALARDATGRRVERMRLQVEHGGPWILGLGVPDALDVEVSVVRPDGQRMLPLRLGFDAVFTQRPLTDRRLAVPLELAAGTNLVELRYTVHGDGRFVPRLYTPMSWRLAATRDDLQNGWIAGAMVMLAGIVLVYRWTGGHSSNLLYALLIFSEVVSMSQVDGYGFALLWPDSPLWNNMAPALLCVIAMSIHAGFAMSFLQLRERYRRLWWLNFAWAWGVPAVLAVLLAAPGPQPQNLLRAEAFGIGLSMLYAPLAVWCAWRAAADAVPGARLYLLGVLALTFFSFVLFPLAILGLGVIPGLEIVAYAKCGQLTEATLFSAALVNRVRRFQADQMDARMRRLVEAEELTRSEQAKRAALERSRAQSLHLASASHDISQPLASLRFAIAALREREPGAAAVSAHLDRSLSYAETLLRDIMEQARHELPEHDDRVEVGTLFAQLTAAWQNQAANQGLHLRYADTALELDASTLIINRLLNNLLSNALRYTERGSVLLGARRRPGGIELQVLDTGPGMLPEQVERLTRPFERAATDEQGFGLGLFIVRSLCAQCGYELRVRSTLGRGTCVGLFIPCAEIK